MKKSNVLPQIYAAVSATLSLLGAGFHGGWASPSLPKLLAADATIPVTSDQGAWIASIIGAGCVVSSVVVIQIVDRFGRKTSLMITAVPMFIGSLLIASARSYWWYYVARFTIGLGMGAIFTIVPMYLGEIAEDRLRGGIGILCVIMLNVGSLIVYAIGPWVSVTVLASIGALFPIIFVSTFCWASESPYYYSMKKKPLKTQQSLAWLRGTNEVDEYLQSVDETVELDRKSRGNSLDLFLVRKNRNALLITLGLTSAQQLSGSGAITTYSTIIFGEVMSSANSSISVIICGIVQFVVAIGVIFLANNIPRRTLLLLSNVLCIIFLLIEAVYFHLKNTGYDMSGASWVSVATIIAYLMSLTLGIGTVPFAMASEIFSCGVKATGISINGVYFSLLGVFVTKLYQVVDDNYGTHVAFYIFTGCCVVTTVFIYFFVPETKGRTLNEIQDDLDEMGKLNG